MSSDQKATPDNVYLMKVGTFNPRHRWYFFSGLDDDEVIIFNGYDSRGPLNVLHTAFDYGKSEPTATYRASIEARFFAFFS